MLPKLTIGTLLLVLGLTGCEAPPDSGGDAGPVLTAEAARDALVEAAHANWDFADFVIESEFKNGKWKTWPAPIKTTSDPEIVRIGMLTVNLKKHTYGYSYPCGGLDGKCGTMIDREGRFEFKDGRWVTDSKRF